MPTTHTPKYPVVDQSPSFTKTIFNFNVFEFGVIAGLGVAGNAIGWLGGMHIIPSYIYYIYIVLIFIYIYYIYYIL